jgi:hypothetical protein
MASDHKSQTIHTRNVGCHFTIVEAFDAVEKLPTGPGREG